MCIRDRSSSGRWATKPGTDWISTSPTTPWRHSTADVYKRQTVYSVPRHWPKMETEFHEQPTSYCNSTFRKTRCTAFHSPWANNAKKPGAPTTRSIWRAPPAGNKERRSVSLPKEMPDSTLPYLALIHIYFVRVGKQGTLQKQKSSQITETI